MQGQKTTVAGDAQSLQVEAHVKLREINELNEKISQTRAQQAGAESQFVGQFKVLEATNKKLNELSQKLSNPAQVDWQSVSRELLALENIWNGFYQQLQSADNLQSVKLQAQGVADSLQRFKQLATASVIDPQVATLAIKRGIG